MGKKLSDESDSFIHWATGRAATIAIIPIPLADVAPLIANELYMIYKIGNLYGYAVTSQVLTMIAGVAGGSFGGKLLASFLPGLKIPIAAGITYGVGKAAKAYFSSGMQLDEKALKEKYKQAEKESKKQIGKKKLKNKKLQLYQRGDGKCKCLITSFLFIIAINKGQIHQRFIP